MLRITKQAVGLDLLVVEKKLERYKFFCIKIHVDQGYQNPVFIGHNPPGISVLPGRPEIPLFWKEAFFAW